MNRLFLISSVFAFFLITSCDNKPAGDKAATGEAAATLESEAKQYAVNTSDSKIMWEGAKPTGKHQGTINITSGNIAVEDGTIKAGSFTFDMNSITNLDQEPGNGKEKLEGHLKSPDFFDAAQHPTSKFELTKVSVLEGDPAATHLIYGNLTIKGITKEIGFKAKVEISGNGVSVTSPQFTIDRTNWDVRYGSNKFFDDLKDKYINDDIGLQLNVTAA